MTTRRGFLGGAGALMLASGGALAQSGAAPALPLFLAGSSRPLMGKGKAQRVVICGGGWGGMTAAKYLRHLAPDLEVVLLERNPVFFSENFRWAGFMFDDMFGAGRPAALAANGGALAA